MASGEQKFITAWQAKLALLAAIVIPTVTATGAFHSIETKMSERDAAVNQRISEVELRVEKNFADKTTMKELQDDVKALRNDMVEIKTLLRQRR